MQTAARFAALMDHLGLARAHVATQVASDVAQFAAHYPERIGGLVLCASTRLDPAPFEKLAARLLLISGDKGLTAQTADLAHARLPGARRHVLKDYAAAAWSDVVADRGGEVAGADGRSTGDRVVPGREPVAGPLQPRLAPGCSTARARAIACSPRGGDRGS